ncbi:MAG: TetR/AcrR family transcriptional regulator [Acidimicrobiales bacterium]
MQTDARAQRRHALVRAAMEVMAEKGLSGTRVADVGRRAGISPGHVLYYFESKADLFLQTLRAVEDELRADAVAAFEGLASAHDRWDWLLEVAAPTGPGDFRLLLWLEAWERSPRDRAVAEVVAELERNWIDLMLSVLRHGRQTGELDVADPDDFALRFSALMDGLTIQVVTGSRSIDRARMLRMCRDVSAAELGWPPRHPDSGAADGAGPQVG